MESHEHSNTAHVHHPIYCLPASSENACYLCDAPNAARSGKQTPYFADSLYTPHCPNLVAVCKHAVAEFAQP
jgi:hypothetical protein